ncbi:7916_t:CDS:10 [Entrophospora sp. SA101]|nr:7916_t:CDS:10 [Entrophospora sp. SA101]CAJ0912571.1 21989_t:CDS:10 [Entrophospora sp. SA101]CAJ0912582.1 21995_t:CDS:10 [Entrophospora sp. SA101]
MDSQKPKLFDTQRRFTLASLNTNSRITSGIPRSLSIRGQAPPSQYGASLGGNNIRNSSIARRATFAGNFKDPRPLRDKQYQAESIQVIILYLKKSRYPGSIDERKLQVPTVKDYHNIFRFLYKKLENKDIPKIEEISTILKEIKYPHANDVSKSALQAVGNVHTWPALLGDGGEIDKDLIFFNYVIKAYGIYLSGGDDFSEAEQEIVAVYERNNSEIITKNTNLQNEINELEKELTELLQIEDPLTAAKNENELLKSDLLKFHSYSSHLDDKIGKLKDNKIKLEEEYQKMVKDLEKLEEEKIEIQKKVDSQPISPDDCERMHKESEQITIQRNKIADGIKEMKKSVWNKQVEFDEKNIEIEKLIHYYNTNIQCLGSDGKKYQLSFNQDSNQIEQMISLDLRNVVRLKLLEVSKKISSERDKTQEKITQVNEEIYHLNDEAQDKERDLSMLEETINVLSQQYELAISTEQADMERYTKKLAIFTQLTSQLESENNSIVGEWKDKREQSQIQ